MPNDNQAVGWAKWRNKQELAHRHFSRWHSVSHLMNLATHQQAVKLDSYNCRTGLKHNRIFVLLLGGGDFQKAEKESLARTTTRHFSLSDELFVSMEIFQTPTAEGKWFCVTHIKLHHAAVSWNQQTHLSAREHSLSRSRPDNTTLKWVMCRCAWPSMPLRVLLSPGAKLGKFPSAWWRRSCQRLILCLTMANISTDNSGCTNARFFFSKCSLQSQTELYFFFNWFHETNLVGQHKLTAKGCLFDSSAHLTILQR